jgi:pSer/pThr/pTyr-binding forkhead associated (FHA) protein
MPPPNYRSPPSLDDTHLETDEEIREALRRYRTAKTKRPGTKGEALPREDEARAERPVVRPPLALLCILDDGSADGEWVRLRADATVIGRNEGDVRIPHDPAISAKHAQVVRQRGSQGYRWTLMDLQSTNGTFVRIGSAILRHDNELIVGAGRYRFESGGASVRSSVPSLIELLPAAPVRRIALMRPEYWIGRDARKCSIARPDDVFANAQHARLFRDAGGQWHIENNRSHNGLWLRIMEPMPLNNACQFRVGEQRFLFRVT